MVTKRISDEPAYVLHRYDWSETSLILEVFTRHHGRIVLVAKGVKRPSSSFRPILLPLQPLHLAFGGDAEIKTLKAAEWQGGHVMPTGDALMSGLYLNELLMLLLAREDPHPLLFDVYASVVQIIASDHGEVLEAALRAFELLLLREIGLLPLLDAQTMTLLALHSGERYSLVPEGGLRQTHAGDRTSLSGTQWVGLQRVLGERVPFTAVLRACAEVASALKPQLRTLLNYHCGVPALRTRQMMIDLQSL
ncbi:MAG: DNA repair protein RecO [Rhodoferax sp.]|uniref:DNA repair protein RecO n=1 Tax=Rhodoferax sp. TaxID=50421 RepID=UPI0026303DEA|nr:DNA repair protein RecO [Rhodoferax sp.]MDD2879871.1 DNA repair protein RecO [Rhodoferax sp.]